MVRICPSCKSHLSRYDRFFCTVCGNTLPSKLADTAEVVEKRPNVFSAESLKAAPGQPAPVDTIVGTAAGIVAETGTKPVLTVKKIFLFVYSAGLIGLSFLLFTIFQKSLLAPNKNTLVIPSQTVSVSTSSVVPQKAEVQNSKYVIKPECSFLEGALFDAGLIKLVPFDVDLFFETSDPQKFMADITGSSIVSDTKFKKFAEDNKDNFTGPSGLFVIKRSDGYIYGFVTKLKAVTPATETEKDPNTLSINGFTIATTDGTILNDVKDAGAEISKNLGQNPVYASAKSVLPKEGRLAIISITKNGNGFLYQLLDKKLTVEFLTIVNSFLDSKLDYAVVL
jgi:hypothetical protein